ncbi:MAG: hypothetical protein ACI9S8_002244 [Chlamydiales bacterium]|jgi:hypothetical protein
MYVPDFFPDRSFHLTTSAYLEHVINSNLSQKVSLVFLKNTGELRRSFSSPAIQLSQAQSQVRLSPISEQLMDYAIAFRNAEKSHLVKEYKLSQQKTMSRCLAKTLAVLPETQRESFLESLSSHDCKVFFVLPALAILSQLKASIGVDSIILNNEVEWSDDKFEFLPEILK